MRLCLNPFFIRASYSTRIIERKEREDEVLIPFSSGHPIQPSKLMELSGK